MNTQHFPSLDEHYAAALGLTPPWVISNIDLDIPGGGLDIVVSYAGKGGLCRECGTAGSIEDHREERSWRHLDMMQFTTTVHCRVPRISCPVHKRRTLITPWAGARSHFTLLFERFAVEVLLATSSVTKATTLLSIS
ncbi:MAG: transposase family protein [bacterium]|nr:transposase family protein [bacterium]